MSDEFDKEAEREKLREKYERDQQKRQATQEMSELLLKGATMTNSHCDRCSDPMFRMNGETFCPSCERTVDGGEAEPVADVERETDASATATRGAAAPVEAPEGEADVPSTTSQVNGNANVDDLAAGRDALAAALRTHARRGADADDPRRARDHLEAAREAAETLATLR